VCRFLGGGGVVVELLDALDESKKKCFRVSVLVV
jgi:hypothetical protein